MLKFDTEIVIGRFLQTTHILLQIPCIQETSYEPADISTSSLHDVRVRNPVTGVNRRNVIEMYESYIPHEPWVRILHEAVMNSNENLITTLANGQHYIQSIIIGNMQGTADGTARSH